MVSSTFSARAKTISNTKARSDSDESVRTSSENFSSGAPSVAWPGSLRDRLNDRSDSPHGDQGRQLHLIDIHQIID